MFKILLVAALATTVTATTASACCLLGVQGRPHGGHTVVRAYNWRHGLGWHRHPHLPAYATRR